MRVFLYILLLVSVQVVGQSTNKLLKKAEKNCNHYNYKRSIKYANQVLAIDSGIAEAWFWRGLSYGFQAVGGQKSDQDSIKESSFSGLRKSIKDFNRAIELKPDYTLAHTQRGVCYAKMYMNKQALRDYGKAVELDSMAEKKSKLPSWDINNLHYNLAVVYERLSEPEKALAALRTCERQDSPDPDVYSSLGRFLIVLEKDKAEGCKYIEKAMKMPTHGGLYQHARLRAKERYKELGCKE